MSCSSAVLSFICLCVFGSLANAQFQLTIGADLGGETQDLHRQMITKHVKQELDCMKLTAKLTDAQRDTILRSAGGLIDQLARDLTDSKKFIVSRGDLLPRKLVDAIGGEAKQVLKPKAFAAYDADLAARRKLQRRGVQRVFLSTLDSVLQLSNQQQMEFGKLFAASWKDAWNDLGPIVVSLGGNGIMMIRKQLKELPRDQIRELLSASQWAAFDGIMNLDPPATANSEEFSELLGRTIAMLKIEEITELFDLSDDQVGSLEKAINLARTESLERIKRAWKANDIANASGQRNIEAILDMYSPMDQLMFSREPWEKAIERELGREQIENYKAQQRHRLKRYIAALAASKASDCDRRVGLTAKQQIAIAKWFEKHMSRDPTELARWLQNDQEIPTSEYEKVLNEDQLKKL